MIVSGDELRLTEEAMVVPNYQKLSGKSTAAGRYSGNLLLGRTVGERLIIKALRLITEAMWK